MSGIVGIVGSDGAPVDRDILRRLTESLRFRGPDACNFRLDGAVGFGHTLLRTTFESEHEKQPCSLDGAAWIVADARVDDQAELIRKLEAMDRRVASGVTDPELILHAYAAWGQDCVAHLLGDFAFAIWDRRTKRLFCARDPFGVKPFYYAQAGGQIIFSNTLDCVRMHPAVSEELDERAVADFLLFGFNQEPTTTAFNDIRRLAPANCLLMSADSIRIRRYWQIPTDGEIRYRRTDDYVAHFRELFRTAVDDRLRTNRVAIYMSGGLDSTSVASTARNIMSDRGEPFSLRAYTAVYDRLFPDDERRYAKLVAEYLEIPISYLVADDYKLYQDWGDPALCRPEPVNEPHLAVFVDQLKALGSQYRVALSGWDGDAVLNDSPQKYFHALFRRGQFGRLLQDMLRYALTRGELPPIGLRDAIKRLRGQSPLKGFPYPEWLNRTFATKLDLLARLKQINAGPSFDHPLRPRAYMALQLPNWAQIFEFYDAGTTSIPVDVRHPFIDLRLIKYLLAIRVVPWCVDKELLRQAMRGALPEEVRMRPKTPLRGDPMLKHLQQPYARWLDRFELAPELSKYVDRAAIQPFDAAADPDQVETALRPLSLNFWLSAIKSGAECSRQEASNE